MVSMYEGPKDKKPSNVFGNSYTKGLFYVYFMKCMIPLINKLDDYCWVGIKLDSKPLSLLKMII
jgi:hypothetical protein